MSLILTVAFQLLIHRQALRGVWVRTMPPFRLDWQSTLVAAILAIVPVYTIYLALQKQLWTDLMYGIVSVGGAVAAAYALRQMTRRTLRQLLLCLATAGVIGIAINVLFTVVPSIYRHEMVNFNLGVGLFSFFQYVPALFVMEEVLFRGAFDGYLYEQEKGNSWLSMLYISALWGLWHIPVYGTTPQIILVLLLVQIAVGIPLSYWMRKSGNLIVPATAHALNDAVRNALGAIP
ncbi:MAG TPA: CPBP family intramembrane glutamic endopeptidase [Anaerolineae bacterium]|nr:CPBP family intramembrane glutamic endopeptidase [Anaerolineae bacterium]